MISEVSGELALLLQESLSYIDITTYIILRYLDEPIPTSSGSDSDTLSGDIKPKWPSPAYKGLIGNVLPEFLSFSEFPFPEPPTTPHQPFPTLVETHAYLRAFSEPHLKDGRIKLNREVVSVSECQPEDGGIGEGWQVTFRDWNGEIQGTRREVEEFWDAVVIATGLWDSPVWPDTEGLEELKNIGMAKHGKWYRGPEVFEGKVRISLIFNIWVTNHPRNH